MSDSCAVEGCAVPLRRGGYCYAHYMKAWRYGTPTPQHPPRYRDLTGSRFGALVVTERAGNRWMCRCDCGNSRTVTSSELNRTREGATCGDKRQHLAEHITYGGAHDRVRSQRGSASSHLCVGCGAPAQHWSYNHDDPDERISDAEATLGVPYSLIPGHYSPRCISCHKRFDLRRLAAAEAPLRGR